MRNLQTEKEIMQNWKCDPYMPLVSTCCITYNHEKYIEDAIEGFLIQETEFPFEILIHDDASTDHTTDIIREYEAKYPKLINPIYQKTNQISQGKDPYLLIFRRSKGEYIALCEGDDYWIDKHKLQKQFDIISNDKNVSIIVHRAFLRTNERLVEWKEWKNNDSIFYFNSKSIVNSTIQFAPTSSYLLRREVIDVLPDWFNQAPVRDFFIEMYSQKVGVGIYIPDMMSVYRQNVEGSFGERVICNPQERTAYIHNLLDYYEIMKNDFPELSNEDFINRKVRQLRELCVCNFLLFDIPELNKNIIKLKEHYFLPDAKIKLLYFFRKNPMALSFILKIYRIRKMLER